MKIIGVGAITERGEVATIEGELPWERDKEDLQHFRDLTMNQTVVMGRKTYEQLGMSLPQRTNVVITRKNSLVNTNVTPKPIVRSSLPFLLHDNSVVDKFIIGGPEIWKWVHLYTGFDVFYLTVIPARKLKNLDVLQSFLYFPNEVLDGMRTKALVYTSSGNAYYRYERG